MEQLLDQLGTKIRKITCKVNKQTGIRSWTVSFYGERMEIDGRIKTEKDFKFTGSTLEEALNAIV